MSFSAEIKDFVNGFQGGMTIGGGIQDRKMEREKWEFEKAFKQDAAAGQSRALSTPTRSSFPSMRDTTANEATEAVSTTSTAIE